MEKQGRNRKKEKEKIAAQKGAQQQEATEKVVVENTAWLEHWNHNPNAVQQMQIELFEKKEFHLFSCVIIKYSTLRQYVFLLGSYLNAPNNVLHEIANKFRSVQKFVVFFYYLITYLLYFTSFISFLRKNKRLYQHNKHYSLSRIVRNVISDKNPDTKVFTNRYNAN